MARSSGGGGVMEIIMLVVILGGAFLLWPSISSAINGGASINAVQTDSTGSGTKISGTSVEDIRSKTKRMIDEITAKARSGGGGGNNRIVQRNSGGGSGGTNISVSGKGATACANGRCTSAYGEMSMGFSNVI